MGRRRPKNVRSDLGQVLRRSLCHPVERLRWPGPFSSLEETLEEDCFNTVTANPKLDSEILPKKTLLEIAGQVVDWENEGTIVINSEKYRVSGDKLIPSD